MVDDDLYAELRAMARSLRAACQKVLLHLTSQVRAEMPGWLLEQPDTALRAIDLASTGVGRYIREDRASYTALPGLDPGAEE